VQADMADAGFDLVGSGAADGMTYFGHGAAWVVDSARPGTYTIHFHTPPTYLIPAAEGAVQTVAAGETIVFSASFIQDANGNGIDDRWEQNYFGNLLTVGPGTDWDADGFPDVSEFWAGTDPLDPESYLGIAALNGNAVGAVVHWSSEADKFYRLCRATNLLSGFDRIVESNIPAVPPENTWTDNAAAGPGPWFYRVNVEK